ncbi:MAG TPA: SPFH domain-containing protein, partial [Spirochaetota bacterium]|nr:SPFH domain-containing protein [Spirochaetota bacterium]
LGAVMSNVIQIAKEWERAIVLRFGKFRKVKGPGIFFLLPFIDRIDKVVDLRTRVTDFVAETTLTKDSVTVTVDALCFWLVWDAEKAICEVENYVEAVVLSSQTALRSAISKNNLSTLLENGEEIEDIVRQEVDKKTTEWGITVSHIEITDIQIPEHLQDSMSKLAQAEREKKSRILFGEAELELAKKFSEASVYYKDNEVALKLRAMNILNEGLKNGNSMIIPSNLMEEMKNIDMFGLKALDEVNKIKKE